MALVFWMVVSPDSAPLGLNAESFGAAVTQHWPGQSRLLGGDESMLAVAVITPHGQTPYQINLHATGTGLGTDGTPDQAYEVAAWARASVPESSGRLWLIDEGYSGHADVPPGATAEQIEAGWLDHAIHGEPTDVT